VKDEEIVKLKFWLDAELTMIRVMLAIILGVLLHNVFVWIGVGVYVLSGIVYAAVRLQYVERKHMGYTKVPKI
jgi:hypothetical protein